MLKKVKFYYGCVINSELDEDVILSKCFVTVRYNNRNIGLILKTILQNTNKTISLK